MKLRAVRLEDAQQILDIYKPYIMETAISFETEVPTLSEFRTKILEVTEKFPWIVYERNNEIVGFAYAASFKSRSAYNWSVESTIYVKKDSHRTGVGKSLYGALIESLKERGFLNIIASISLPNKESVALHEHLGFKNRAILKDVGFKMGQWWDVGFWQLQFQKPKQPHDVASPGKPVS